MSLLLSEFQTLVGRRYTKDELRAAVEKLDIEKIGVQRSPATVVMVVDFALSFGWVKKHKDGLFDITLKK